METIPASVLGRNDRVVLDPEELPYLVDSVKDIPSGVAVTYSSGDVIEYAADAMLTVLD